jgi:hypothetical protein
VFAKGGGGGHGGGGHGGGGHGGHGGGHHSGGHHSGGYYHGGYYSGGHHYGYHNGYLPGYYGGYGYGYYPGYGYGYYGTGYSYPYYNSGYSYPTYGYAPAYVTPGPPATVATPDTSQGRYLGIDEMPAVDGVVRGMQVMRVYPGSAAERAGLQAGDVIHSANGYAIQEHGNLTWVISNLPPNGVLQMSVRTARDGMEHIVSATIP